MADGWCMEIARPGHRQNLFIESQTAIQRPPSPLNFYEASRFVPTFTPLPHRMDAPDRHNGQRDKRTNERTDGRSVRLLDGVWH